MKASLHKGKYSAPGLTFVEMIGVLAVIGILVALLMPKVFEVVNNSRLNSAAVSLASLKTAASDHVGKYGALAVISGVETAAPVTNFDQVLISEGFLDKPFALKIAAPTNTSVYLVSLAGTLTGTAVSAAANPDPTVAGNWMFDLQDPTAVNTVTGKAELAVVLTGVLESDAKALNDIIDGPTLGSSLGTDDRSGRVKYHQAGGFATMTIYVTHR